MFARALISIALVFWPPWISIEAPVSPFDPDARGAAFLVHAMERDHVPQVSELTATAEGLVNGRRQTMTVRLDATRRPGVFALRKQWPTDGTWLVRVTLEETTAIVTFERDGRASARVPVQPSDARLPRPVGAADIDSTLAALAARGR